MSLEELEQLSLTNAKKELDATKKEEEEIKIEEETKKDEVTKKVEPINFMLTPMRLKIHFNLILLLSKIASLSFAHPGKNKERKKERNNICLNRSS